LARRARVESVAGTNEFDLIARIRERAGTREDVVLGIGDDAAVLRVPAGQDLVASTDTLNAGVHFPQDTAPADIGWKALAVNLSDLAAMGATPAWCTLALSLPDADPAWLDAFLDGFCALAAVHDVALVGGDTTRGPLSITVTAHGLVPHGTALRRSGARIGDDIWVSGTIGDAAAGLALLQRPSPDRLRAADRSQLLMRLNRPTPRIALGIALRGIASACIDLSDGLTADLDHLSRASDVGAELELAALPTSDALRMLDRTVRESFQLGGGDDYELCFTVPTTHADRVRAAAASTDTRVTCIGHIHGGGGLRVLSADRMLLDIKPGGYQHFAPASGSQKS
jgi:thiamine-monophosphate kinase